MKVKNEREVAQSCPTLSMDCSLPASSIHGIFQARVLEWGAIAFSGAELGQVQNHRNTRISELLQEGERPSLLEVNRKSRTFQLDLEM